MNEDDKSGDTEREYHAAQQRAASQDSGTAHDEAIAQLPHLERTAMILVKDGMSYKEIASIMDITESAASGLLARARGRAKALLIKVENKDHQ